MTKTTIEKFRKQILAEKARLERDRDRLNHVGDPASEEIGELTDFDQNHPGDLGTITFEREKDLALNENVEDLLAQINDALGRMENGTYGLCIRCNRPIAEARLEALPYAAYCIECQNHLEGM